MTRKGHNKKKSGNQTQSAAPSTANTLTPSTTASEDTSSSVRSAEDHSFTPSSRESFTTPAADDVISHSSQPDASLDADHGGALITTTGSFDSVAEAVGSSMTGAVTGSRLVRSQEPRWKRRGRKPKLNSTSKASRLADHRNGRPGRRWRESGSRKHFHRSDFSSFKHLKFCTEESGDTGAKQHKRLLEVDWSNVDKTDDSALLPAFAEWHVLSDQTKSRRLVPVNVDPDLLKSLEFRVTVERVSSTAEGGNQYKASFPVQDWKDLHKFAVDKTTTDQEFEYVRSSIKDFNTRLRFKKERLSQRYNFPKSSGATLQREKLLGYGETLWRVY